MSPDRHQRELKVNCPTCKEIVIWSEASPFRPFCSQRCKLIDFGEWASERNTIAGDPARNDAHDEEQD